MKLITDAAKSKCAGMGTVCVCVYMYTHTHTLYECTYHLSFCLPFVLPELHEQPYAEPPVSQLSPCPSFCACFPCGEYLVNISKNVSRTMYLLQRMGYSFNFSTGRKLQEFVAVLCVAL